ncbi:hypothetical protein B5S27_g5721 [[Candida] boidinii]|nr:hypothetical protein B5S27_g5721 [[Candida] boidinii]
MYVKAFPEKYNIQQRADIPAYVYAVSIGYAFIVPAVCAVFDKIYIVTFIAVLTYYANIILIIWNVSSKLLLSAFYLQEKKAFVIALINALAYATKAWVTLLQWNTKDAPNYYNGYRANIACVSATLLFFILAYVLDKWDLKLIPKYAGNRHLGTDGYFLHQSDSETSSIDDND